MYKIYANDQIIHHPNLFDEYYVCLDPVVDKATSGHGSMTFTMPPNHPCYDDIESRTTIIRVYDDTEELFRGRVLDTTKDFYGNKEIYVEGELAFLLDSYYRPFGFSGGVSEFFEMLIENHNSQVDETRQFVVGEVTVTDPNDYITRSSETALTTWELINTRLLDLLGGYVRTRYEGGVRYIDYLADFEDYSDQVIKFGENLLDLEEYISAADVITCLIPYGAEYEEDDENYTEQPENGSYNGNRLTIESVNDGLDYIESETGIALYGRVWGTNTWDDVTIADNLLTKAESYLNSNIVESATMTINALDLHLVDVDTARIHVGEYVRVYSRPHNLNVYMLCTEQKIDLAAPDKTEITLGAGSATLTGITASGSTTSRNYSSTSAGEYSTTELLARIIAIENSYVTKSNLDNLIANSAVIDTLVADVAAIQEAYITTADIETLLASYATIESLSAATARIDTLEAVTADIDTLTANVATIMAAYITEADVETLLANHAYITTAEVETLLVDYATFESLETTYAAIDFANVDFAKIDVAKLGELYAATGIISDLTIQDGAVTGTLTGVTIVGDCIEANTIVASSLIIEGEDGLFYKLNTDGITVTSEQTEYNSLSGTIITAQSVTADKISVSDLVAFGATIGGFIIADDALYSVGKSSIDSAAEGVYLDSTGQIAVGDSSNFLKYYYDSDTGAYRLEISADNISIDDSGVVTYTALSTSGSTIINGDNITTGTISADRIDVNELLSQDVLVTGSFQLDNGVWAIYQSDNGIRIGIGATEEGEVYYSYLCIEPAAFSIAVNGPISIIASDGVDIDGALTVSGATALNSTLKVSGATTLSGGLTSPYIELSAATPYIDFHYGSSSDDYTSRIIESASGTLTFICKNGALFDGKIYTNSTISSEDSITAQRDTEDEIQINVINSLAGGRLVTSNGGNFGLYSTTFSAWLARTDIYGANYIGNSNHSIYIQGSTIYHNGTAYSSSDRRLKNSIEAVPDGYESMLDKVEPIRYKFNGDDRYRLGYIAQDIEAAGLTELISKSDDGMLYLDYNQIIPLLHQKINCLESRIKMLEEAKA